MDRKPAVGADLVIPVLAAGLTIYFLYSVAGMDWEAKANGVIVGTILLVLVAAQGVRSILAFSRRRAEAGFGPLFAPREALPTRLGMLAIMIVFVASVQYLGLGLGLFLALCVALLVMGVRQPKRVALVAFCVALASSILFTVVLDSGLPRGPVEHLMTRLVEAAK